MTEEQIVLARRAVACKGWRWMPGMLTTEGMRVVVRCFGDDNEPDDAIPDLTDPATLGCLLALVREAWGRHSGTARRWSVDGWYWHADYNEQTACGHRLYRTEAEALVAALEDAP
jgi:hypothetical protein